MSDGVFDGGPRAAADAAVLLLRDGGPPPPPQVRRPPPPPIPPETPRKGRTQDSVAKLGSTFIQYEKWLQPCRQASLTLLYLHG